MSYNPSQSFMERNCRERYIDKKGEEHTFYSDWTSDPVRVGLPPKAEKDQTASKKK